MAGYRTWSDVDRLEPDDLNNYLMGQSVPRFSNAAMRDAQMGGVVAGQLCYLIDVDQYLRYTGSVWVNLVTPAYPTGARPNAGSVPVGTGIYDLTLGAPVWSNGTTWSPAGITGPTGPTGPPGPTGGAGPTGATGPAPAAVAAVAGLATLAAGTATVAALSVTALSRIRLTAQNLGTVTVPSALAVSARTPGTGFTILASQGTDTSDVAWLIDPA